MRHRIATTATVLGLALVAGLPAHAQPSTQTAHAAKTCSAGYVHAVIGGAEKCLRRGEFCAHRYERRYERYGFHCVSRDRRGNYHLR